MALPNKTTIRKVIATLKKSKLKYVPLSRLSRMMGLYSDVLGNELVYFEPMIKLDPEIDIRPLLPKLEEYVAPAPKDPEAPKEKRVVVSKKELSEYKSIGDFVYKKFTSVGGLVERTTNLSDEDLHILLKLVNNEVAARKPKAKRRKKKK
jgi:hypothetical protein